MRTRDRLNLAFAGGTLLLAVLVAVVTGSSVAFVVTLASGLAVNVARREIR